MIIAINSFKTNTAVNTLENASPLGSLKGNRDRADHSSCQILRWILRTPLQSLLVCFLSTKNFVIRYNKPPFFAVRPVPQLAAVRAIKEHISKVRTKSSSTWSSSLCFHEKKTIIKIFLDLEENNWKIGRCAISICYWENQNCFRLINELKVWKTRITISRSWTDFVVGFVIFPW